MNPKRVQQSTDTKGSGHLRARFLEHSEYAVAFCDAALCELETGRSMERELMGLHKAIVKIRETAERIGLSDVAKFGQSYESCLEALMRMPTEASMHFHVLREGVRILREPPPTLADPVAAKIKSRLDAITKRHVQPQPHSSLKSA